MSYVSLQERFRQAEAVCSKLPAGYGWKIELETDGSHVPVFSVVVDTGYDNPLGRNNATRFSVDSDDNDLDFELFLRDLESTVDKVCARCARKEPENKSTESDDDEEWLPF